MNIRKRLLGIAIISGSGLSAYIASITKYEILQIWFLMLSICLVMFGLILFIVSFSNYFN